MRILLFSKLPLLSSASFYPADLISYVEFGLNDYRAIEIKADHAPIVGKGFHSACEDLSVKRKFVAYAGNEVFPFGNETTVLSLSDFIEELKQCSG